MVEQMARCSGNVNSVTFLSLKCASKQSINRLPPPWIRVAPLPDASKVWFVDLYTSKQPNVSFTKSLHSSISLRALHPRFQPPRPSLPIVQSSSQPLVTHLNALCFRSFPKKSILHCLWDLQEKLGLKLYNIELLIHSYKHLCIQSINCKFKFA